MILNKNYSVIKQFMEEAEDSNDLFGRDPNKPRIIYISDDLNEPEDEGFYSDRFPNWCSEKVKKTIYEKVGLSVYSYSIWSKKENAEKAIKCYCTANNMMKSDDKIVVTSIIHLRNKCDGSDYFYVTYRIDK
jgi:hypothetical protein